MIFQVILHINRVNGNTPKITSCSYEIITKGNINFQNVHSNNNFKLTITAARKKVKTKQLKTYSCMGLGSSCCCLEC